jgi:hypothetical protein
VSAATVAVRLSLVIAVSFEVGTVAMGSFRRFAGAAAAREAPPGFEPGVEFLQFYPTLCILSSTVASDMLAELREDNQSLAAVFVKPTMSARSTVTSPPRV